MTPVETPHDKFRALKELCQITQTIRADGSVELWRMIQTGDLEFFDYDRGFLCVHVSSHKHFPEDGLANCYVCFSSVDDGDLEGMTADITLDAANAIAIEIMASVFEPMHKLPHIEELQQLLQRFGIRLN